MVVKGVSGDSKNAQAMDNKGEQETAAWPGPDKCKLCQWRAQLLHQCKAR